MKKLFVVGPLSSFAPWKNEYKECFNKEADIANLANFNNIYKSNYLTNHNSLTKEITFINYEGFMKIVDEMKYFINNNNVMLVLDEAHKIKNPESLRAKNVMEISTKAKSRIVLTGTPIPNGYKDLYNLFEFIWPDRNVVGFNLNTLGRIGDIRNSKNMVNQLMINIDPYYVRIRKSYLNLPPPIFNKPILVPMGNIQQEIYDFISEDFLKRDIEIYDMELQQILKKAKLVRLMQCLTNPKSIGESLESMTFFQFEKTDMYKKIVNFEKLETPSKYYFLLDLVLDIIDRKEKVVIWVTYTSVLLSVKRFLNSMKIEVKLLYGGTENRIREEIIDEFHTNNKLRVILANPAAVAESISLHKVCHNAIYLDKSFNAAHYMQSKDRIHRVGLSQDILTNYYYILSKDTIDEVIHDRVLEKEQIMLDVIEGQYVPLFNEEFNSDASPTDMKEIESYLKGRL